MRYLNRKPGEAVIVNASIEVRVVEVRGVFEAIKQENRAAVEAVRALPAAGIALPERD